MSLAHPALSSRNSTSLHLATYFRVTSAHFELHTTTPAELFHIATLLLWDGEHFFHILEFRAFFPSYARTFTSFDVFFLSFLSTLSFPIFLFNPLVTILVARTRLGGCYECRDRVLDCYRRRLSIRLHTIAELGKLSNH